MSAPAEDLVWADFRTAAQDRGPAAALGALHDAVAGDALPCGPGGHAVVPSWVALRASRVWAGGVETGREEGRETILGEIPLDGETLIMLRHERGPGAAGRPAPAAAWEFGLLWVRLGLSERLLAACVEYLEGRRAAGTPLLFQQLVKGALADAVIAQAEIGAVLAHTGADPAGPVAADLHRQITATDRALLPLLGASGFTAAGAGLAAHVSELLADCYRRPPEDGEPT